MECNLKISNEYFIQVKFPPMNIDLCTLINFMTVVTEAQFIFFHSNIYRNYFWYISS